MDTLILNADASPLCLVPKVSACTWRVAIEDMWMNRVQVLHTYEDWVVHSPSMEFAVPAVVVMNRYAKPKSHVRFSPKMVKMRDDYTCQYCGDKFAENRLTMDHVVPDSHGGPKSWDNIVAACGPCNNQRGNNTRIRPNRMPYRPSYWEMVGKSKRNFLHVPHESWAYYLDWPEELLVIRK